MSDSYSKFPFSPSCDWLLFVIRNSLKNTVVLSVDTKHQYTFSLKKKNNCKKELFLWGKTLKKCILFSVHCFPNWHQPRGCENSSKASCPAGEQYWHMMAWSPVVFAVSFLHLEAILLSCKKLRLQFESIYFTIKVFINTYETCSMCNLWEVEWSCL